jgi:hypothetical protein
MGDCRRRQSCRRQVLRQDLRLRLGGTREVLFKRMGNAGVQLLALRLEQ